MARISMKSLLEAGVHFGHGRKGTNPKMAPYIFTERNGIYIIDLQKTVRGIDNACAFVKDVTIHGKSILFVGTKPSARNAVELAAQHCGMHYVNSRWLGGTLTNFSTIKRRIARLDELDNLEESGQLRCLPKKEGRKLQIEHEKLTRNLGGIRRMKALPDILFVVDPHKEHIAVSEARKLGITVIGLVDTNGDPDQIDFIIPANDDSIKSVNLITSVIANAIQTSDLLHEMPHVVGNILAVGETYYPDARLTNYHAQTQSKGGGIVIPQPDFPPPNPNGPQSPQPNEPNPTKSPSPKKRGNKRGKNG